MKYWNFSAGGRVGARWLAGLAGLALVSQPAAAQSGRHAGRPPRPAPEVVVEDSLPRGQLARPALPPLPDSLAALPEMPAVDSARLAWLAMLPTQRELIGDRMSCFETEAPHQFNDAVLAYVNLFTQRQRGYTQRVLEREQFYFPIFEKYLTQYNLPTELKYLAVVESALIPTAKSPVGATGLWQFMGPTAGDLRLKRDEWVDERMHPEKATEAACKHLRYLYGIFHDWELVLAAYNWGAGSMQRVMRRTGKKTFWDLYPYLPAETRNYVPTFTAVMYTLKYAQQHQLHAPELHYLVAEPLDTLALTGQPVDLRRLSRALGFADSLALQRFNPEVRRNALPAGYRPYVLRYPSAARPHLGDVDRPTLLDYCRPAAELPQPLTSLPPRLAGVTPFPTQDLLAAADGERAAEAEPAPRFRRLRHQVRKGETVASLAERFEVSPARLRRWNELAKGQPLRPGRELVILVPLPAAPAAKEPQAAEVAAVVPLTPKVLPTAQPIPVEDPAQKLAAANARYAREAATAAAREKAQAQQLARLQRVETARLAVRAIAERQRLAIARTVATAQAAQAKAAREQQATAVTAADDSTEHEVTSTVTVATPEAARPTAAGQRTLAISAGQPMRTGEPGVIGPRAAPGKPAGAEAPTSYAARSQSPAATAHPAKRGPETRFHQVQRGDTLYNISRRFGISVEQLRKLNRLSSDEVKLGQKLVVQTS